VTRLEVMIDYPEEDLEDIAVPDVSGALQEMQEKLQHMLEESQNGRMIRDGVMAAIAGTPNAGKSSLLNRLLQEERAIVTDVPGTTRDVLEEWITLRGVPVCLVDTAGIRETDDTVEKIGVSRARQYLDRADIILAVIDGSRPLTDEDKDILQSAADKNVIIVLNKTDLPSVMTSQDLSTYGFPICPISASTGDGLEELKDRLLQEVLKGGFTDGPSALLTNTRHIELVRQSAEALERARQSLQDGMPLDCAVIDIRQAWDTLGSITGDTVHDDIVEEIFSRFCLGK
jgi:tRNA modification GTPase